MSDINLIFGIGSPSVRPPARLKLNRPWGIPTYLSWPDRAQVSAQPEEGECRVEGSKGEVTCDLFLVERRRLVTPTQRETY